MMALAKFVQFMSLTCEIKGVPPVYEDFANGLAAFNFDAFGWFPFHWFGIPTRKDIKNYKEDMIAKLKEELDIKHATLLIQYCLTRTVKGDDLLYANAILERKPQSGRMLEHNMNRFAQREAVRKAKEALLSKEEKEQKRKEKAEKNEEAL
jgi:hypothetical protein